MARATALYMFLVAARSISVHGAQYAPPAASSYGELASPRSFSAHAAAYSPPLAASRAIVGQALLPPGSAPGGPARLPHFGPMAYGALLSLVGAGIYMALEPDDDDEEDFPGEVVYVFNLSPKDGSDTGGSSNMAIDHIINSAAKSNYMSAGQINVPIVFRGPNGAAAGVDAQHSQIECEGKDVTITAFSKMVGYPLQAAEILSKEGISAEVINLRSIRPLDRAAINASVRKTNRLVTLEEGFPQHGVGAEICMSVVEESFEYLDAPVERIAGADVPMPYAANLERMAVPQIEVIVRAARRACYRALPMAATA